MGEPNPYKLYNEMPAWLINEWMAYDFLHPLDLANYPLQAEYDKKRPLTELEQQIKDKKQIMAQMKL